MTAKIKLNAASGGGSVSLKAPTSTTSNAAVELQLPVADGSAGQFMKTDGSGNLSFDTAGGGGKILQVLSVNKTDTTSYTGTSFADISGITLNITPQTNSKVLIQFCYCFGHDNNEGGAIRIAKVKSGTTTYLATADTAGYNGVNDTMVSYAGSSDPSNQIYHQSFHHLDQNVGGDGSTQITYKLQWRIGSGAIYLGRDSTGSISEYAGGNEFTLMEVAA